MLLQPSVKLQNEGFFIGVDCVSGKFVMPCDFVVCFGISLEDWYYCICVIEYKSQVLVFLKDISTLN